MLGDNVPQAVFPAQVPSIPVPRLNFCDFVLSGAAQDASEPVAHASVLLIALVESDEQIANMDFDSIRNQVSNLTLYDVKAGVRKVQNGTIGFHLPRRRR